MYWILWHVNAITSTRHTEGKNLKAKQENKQWELGNDLKEKQPSNKIISQDENNERDKDPNKGL